MLTNQLIINLLLILAVAWPMGALFSRFGLPVMLGRLPAETQFSALVLMAFITTLSAPLMLRWSVVKTCIGKEKDQFCQLRSEKKQRP